MSPSAGGRFNRNLERIEQSMLSSRHEEAEQINKLKAELEKEKARRIEAEEELKVLKPQILAKDKNIKELSIRLDSQRQNVNTGA
jgi:predicted  nucleic acid-binding Zn-ribbon protein